LKKNIKKEKYMSQKGLSQALNDFVNVLTEQELEPIRLDLIRIENDFRESVEQIQQKVENDLKEAVAQIQQKIENELNKRVEEGQKKLDEMTETMQKKEEEAAKQSIDDEKFYILKEAIENLAVKASEALAEGFSEQEEQYTGICGELDSKISVLERKLAQTGSEIQESLNGKIAEIETKLAKSGSEIHENLNTRISAIEKKFNF
jgi:paraquat-inducible protein B